MAPKDVGGLGLGSIRAVNLALLAKWAWRFNMEPNSLWARAIRGFHNSQVTRRGALAAKNSSGVWRDIDRSLNALEVMRINRSEIIRRSSDSRSWISDFSINNIFCVSLLRNQIEKVPNFVCDGPFLWLKSVPLKVTCFVWRARLNRIPTAVKLEHRGIKVKSILCSSCIYAEESVDHLLVSCPFASVIWNSLSLWCDIPLNDLSSVKDITNFAANYGHGSKMKTILCSILYGALWCLWRTRNDRLFNGIWTNPKKVVENIFAMVFTWLKHRWRKGRFVWNEWVLSPFSCLG